MTHYKCHRYRYHIGIIGYLNEFNKLSKIDSAYKEIQKEYFYTDPTQTSYIEPEQYKKRFIEFISRGVLMNQEEHIAGS